MARRTQGTPRRRPGGTARRDRPVDRFLADKTRTLEGRAHRLAKLDPKTVGLRAEDRAYAPSARHFAAANQRLATIAGSIGERLSDLRTIGRAPHETRLLRMAMVEREIDRARRAFGLFFEVFAQRGAAFAPSLMAHDNIARDCYAAIEEGGGGLLRKPLLPPLTYLEHGYSPATMRRGVTLKRLLGEPNPFPLIRIPWDRDRPWQATFLHEVAHNLQADLGLWEENKQAVGRRLAETDMPVSLQAIWQRYQKEVLADCVAVLLGGPAAAWGMAEFLAHPESKVANFKSGGVHPPGYLRIFMLAEMARRMGFAKEGEQLALVWRTLYGQAANRRLPPDLLASAASIIPIMVDEIAYQPRRALAERSLADVISFTADDQRAIRAGASALAEDRVPSLPPRFLVSAARYAISKGAAIPRLGAGLIEHLAHRHLSNPPVRLVSQHGRGNVQALAA
ncbi:MAG: hypothetical protein OEU92_06025 [Alphaproteobacteria bacterium]|nr:hypothetical protein [Alphaproteobacteria bacterium]